MNRGILYAAGSYVLWGLLPIYWKLIEHVPAGQILAHRIAWAALVAIALVGVRKQWGWVNELIHNRRTLLTFIATAALISVNWFVYIWAVNAGHIVETSLGYFINPLVNVLLGVLVLRERLRISQGVAVAVALAGVLYLAFQYGSPPWISLILAFSFGLYGLLRKTATLNSVEGFAAETALLFVPALAFLVFEEVQGVGAFGHTDALTTTLLVLAGLVTAIPLIMFAEGARQITMTTLGILQYIAPTLQFLIGVLIYGEELNANRLVGFALIWLALGIYSFDGVLRGRRVVPSQAAVSASD